LAEELIFRFTHRQDPRLGVQAHTVQTTGGDTTEEEAAKSHRTTRLYKKRLKNKSQAGGGQHRTQAGPRKRKRPVGEHPLAETRPAGPGRKSQATGLTGHNGTDKPGAPQLNATPGRLHEGQAGGGTMGPQGKRPNPAERKAGGHRATSRVGQGGFLPAGGIPGQGSPTGPHTRWSGIDRGCKCPRRNAVIPRFWNQKRGLKAPRGPKAGTYAATTGGGHKPNAKPGKNLAGFTRPAPNKGRWMSGNGPGPFRGKKDSIGLPAAGGLSSGGDQQDEVRKNWGQAGN